MLNKLFMIFCCFLMIGCSTIKYVPIEKATEVHTETVTVYRDTTIFKEIPVEIHSAFSRDTSILETSLAVSSAYIDTSTLMIRHTLANKADSIQIRYKYLEKTVYKDSISVKEVPVEVVKEKTVYPKSYWWMLGSLLGIALAIILFIASKMKSFL